MARIFLLSPAHCGGERARMLLRPQAQFALAQQLRKQGAPLGEVFAFLSGLYFRGKWTYARAFGSGMVITPNRGLLPVDTMVTHKDVARFGEVDIHHQDVRYTRPLVRDLRALPEQPVVLLGSIASAKYVEPMVKVLGERLLVPAEFAGRGDMSRGGLLLRHARAGRELTYVPIGQAARHGPRPPKLARLDRARLASFARAACQQLVADGGLSAAAFVDRTGSELARVGDRPVDRAALMAGQIPRGVIASFVGRHGVLLARGRRALQLRLDEAAARLNAQLEGVS
jgi:hypothetical protein